MYKIVQSLIHNHHVDKFRIYAEEKIQMQTIDRISKQLYFSDIMIRQGRIATGAKLES